MTPAPYTDQAPVPPPSYHQTMATALHLDALTLVTRLHLLELCRVAGQGAQRQCPPPLPPGARGAPRSPTARPPLLVWLRRPRMRRLLSRVAVRPRLCAR